MPGKYDGSTVQRGATMSGPGKGKKGIYGEVPGEIADAIREYAKARGEKLGDVMARSFVREMQNPPPPVVHPPLPPLPPPTGPKKPKGK